jgi:twitching motility protein PilT
VGEPPVYRIDGKLKRSRFGVLTNDDCTRLIGAILNEERQQLLQENKELDLAYSVPDLARFRVNCFYQSECLGAVLRVIPIEIKSCDQLGLPPIVKEFASVSRGLVLVTGPTGSGKSTTLAAMIDHINTNFRRHIITIEDPVEFIHLDKESTINQRELGVDTHSFAAALRHILRQSPDVILVGELRDLETIALAITAAETGHLVLATLHTTDAAQTVDRIIDVFPPEQQEQVRLQLSTSLMAVVSQTLLPRRDGKGRIAAFEVLTCHSGVRNIIREGKTHQVYSLIQGGAQYGMQLLDSSLLDLVRRGLVSYEEALAKTSNPHDFDQTAQRLGVRRQ